MRGGVQEALGGSTSAPLIVTVDIQEDVLCEDGEHTHVVYTYDHSWQEIHDALSAKRPAYMAYSFDDGEEVSVSLQPITRATQAMLDGDEYYEVLVGGDAGFTFSDANSLVYESECGGK